MATLQEVLAEHRSDLSGRCISRKCTGTDWSNWPEHVVAMVEEAGLLVMTVHEYAENLYDLGEQAWKGRG